MASGAGFYIMCGLSNRLLIRNEVGLSQITCSKNPINPNVGFISQHKYAFLYAFTPRTQWHHDVLTLI